MPLSAIPERQLLTPNSESCQTSFGSSIRANVGHAGSRTQIIPFGRGIDG